jgi:hypothetical protein
MHTQYVINCRNISIEREDRQKTSYKTMQHRVKLIILIKKIEYVVLE